LWFYIFRQTTQSNDQCWCYCYLFITEERVGYRWQIWLRKFAISHHPTILYLVCHLWLETNPCIDIKLISCFMFTNFRKTMIALMPLHQLANDSTRMLTLYFGSGQNISSCNNLFTFWKMGKWFLYFACRLRFQSLRVQKNTFIHLRICM
jgi:hypothetical protein